VKGSGAILQGSTATIALVAMVGCARPVATPATPPPVDTASVGDHLLLPSDKAIPRLEGPAPVDRSPLGKGAGGYRFLRPDHVGFHQELWRRVLAPYVGQPDLHYLEIGTYEGRSFVWMLDNVFTHPTSRATGIDINLRPELLHNISVARANDRVVLYEGRSEQALRSLRADTVDVAYIDGSHRLYDCLSDAVRVWPLVRDGGVVIFDDYEYNLTSDREAVGPVHDELTPRLCIETFLAGVISEFELLAWNEARQVVVRKRVRRCQRDLWECTPLGERYDYYWIKSELVERDTKRTIKLRPVERRGLEKLYASRRPDAPRFNLDESLQQDADVREFLTFFQLDASLFTEGRRTLKQQTSSPTASPSGSSAP
jgi:hypothetical protein